MKSGDLSFAKLSGGVKLEARSKIVLLHLSLIFCSFLRPVNAGQDAFESDYCKQKRSSISSVTVAFDYQSSPRSFAAKLQNPHNDGQFFYDHISASVAPGKRSFLKDKDVSNGSKVSFLKMLQEKTAGSEIVNFNYSGHGVRRQDGGWAMMLPGVPRELSDQCIVDSAGKEKGAGGLQIRSVPGVGSAKDCDRALAEYLVTPEDIQNALPGKKIVAFLDACYSGAASFPGGIVVSASDQTASDGNTGSLPNGTLTNELRKLIEGCAKTQDPTRTTLADVLGNFSDVGVNDRGHRAALMSKYLRTLANIGGQHLGVVREGPQLWESCLKLGSVPESRRQNCTQKGGSAKENPLTEMSPESPFLVPEAQQSRPSSPTR